MENIKNMENIKFFFVEKELLTLYVLRGYVCDDIIIKIIENSKKDKKQIAHMNIIHRDIFRYSSLSCPLSALLFGFGCELDELLRPHHRDASVSPDIYRNMYLKGKMSEPEHGHYSKHRNTWIKFQYHLTKSARTTQNETYGFNGVKKFSDVLYII